MDRISIVELQRALEPVLGLMGARLQILGALRCNELKSSCDEFVGVNASDYSAPYPDNGADAELPPHFWTPEAWANDGENRLEPTRDRESWIAVASWERGEFTISGSHGGGRRPVLRRAIGVHCSRDGARDLLRRFGVARPGGKEEMAVWAVDWMRGCIQRGEPYGQAKMAQPFLSRFPNANRKVIRGFHADAKRILRA